MSGPQCDILYDVSTIFQMEIKNKIPRLFSRDFRDFLSLYFLLPRICIITSYSSDVTGVMESLFPFWRMRMVASAGFSLSSASDMQ